jgi:hypothetical protein
LQAFASNNEAKIFGKRLGSVTSIGLNRLEDVQTAEEAEVAIKSYMNHLEAGSVVLFYPQFERLQGGQSYFAYKPISSELVIYAIQVKLDSEEINCELPSWVTSGFSVGGIRGKTFEKPGWVYLSKAQIEEFLGYSLKIMHPSNWSV